MPRTELKYVELSQWDKVELKWGSDMKDWLQKLAREFATYSGFRDGSEAVSFAANNPGAYAGRVGPHLRNCYTFNEIGGHDEFAQWINDNERTEINRFGHAGSFLIGSERVFGWISPRNLPAPFNYSTNNTYEIMMWILWRGERESQIFYREPGKVGTIKSRKALEYLQKIVPNLMVEYRSREEIEREERERRERERREREAREQREREERERREREERARQIQQQRTNAIQAVESHYTNQKISGKTIEQILGSKWKEGFNSLNTENEINNERNKLIGEINKFKQEEVLKQQKNQAIAAVEEHWNKNKDNNGKINNQTIEQLLGSNWKDSFNSLTTSEQVKREQEKLTATISKAKEEANKEVCNIVGHQKIKEEFDRLKSANLTDYTSLTQKSAEQKTNDKDIKYTTVTFHESYQTNKGGKYSSLDISNDLKELVVDQPKIWVITKYLEEEAENRWIEKKDLVDPSSFLFTYLNNLWELEQVKKDKAATEQEKDNLKKNNQELQKQLQAAMNELMGVYQVEEQMQAVQVQGNLPLQGGNK